MFIFVLVLGKDVDALASLRLYNTVLPRICKHFLKKSFSYFFLDILKPTVDKHLAFNILQNRRVPDCAVSVVCQLIGNRVIDYAPMLDHRWQPSCVVLARFEEVVTLHVNLLHRSQKCIFLSARRRLSLFFV